MLQYEKFPVILDSEQQVIWDTRQSLQAPNMEVCLVIRPGMQSSNIQKLQDQHPASSRIVCTKKLQPFLKEGATSQNLELVEDADLWLAECANRYFGRPSEEINLIGVTGTNGKSSCVDFLAKAGSFSGQKTMLVGTLGVEVFSSTGERLQSLDTGFTTPEAPSLQKLLRNAVDEGIEMVAMEVSSHALSLGRVHGCIFQSALLTNITQDHLDFHGTMKNYANAKGELFRKYLRGKGVFYLGDDYCRQLYAEMSGEMRKETSSIDAIGVEAGTQDEIFYKDGKLNFSWRGDVYSTLLKGNFHAANLRMCLEVVGEKFSSPAQIQKFLDSYHGAPGRMEEVSEGVFVDYAHTPAALELSLKSLRDSMRSDAKLSVVFGCGGDRDRSKRSQMGVIATKLADFVFLTNDNPRSEDPSSIVSDILPDRTLRDEFEGKGVLFVELDREKAIALALSQRSGPSCVLIAGKGHEDYQILGEQRIHFSDKEVALKYV